MRDEDIKALSERIAAAEGTRDTKISIKNALISRVEIEDGFVFIIMSKEEYGGMPCIIRKNIDENTLTDISKAISDIKSGVSTLKRFNINVV